MEKTKLWCQLPIRISDENEIAFGHFIDMVKETYDKVKGPGTEVVIEALQTGMSDVERFSYYALRFINDREILSHVMKAEKEGYDGVVIACFFDPSLWAARQLVKIPVVGIAETSMRLAGMMGSKFAVVTSDPGYVFELEENIKKYGMTECAITRQPARSISLSMEEFLGGFAGGFTTVLDSFSEVSRRCQEDGAEVIIAGCGLLSTMLTTNGVSTVEGLPIIDPMVVGLKVGELFVQLHRAGLPFVSRKGMYREIPGKVLGSL